MTLLTPAVMHSSSLEKLTQQPIPFFKKYLFSFALLQGLFGVLLGILMLSRTIYQIQAIVKPGGEEAIIAANFSKATIDKGELTIDIKPAIWTYSIKDTPTRQLVVAVDSLGTMNKYFWDDRMEKGVVKKVYGIGFMKEGVLLKGANGVWFMQYSKLIGMEAHDYTKESISQKFTALTSGRTILLVYLLAALVYFAIAFIFGYVFHLFFTILIGGVVALLTNYEQLPLLKSMKIASGLYIMWVYISLLINISGFVFQLNGSSVSFVVMQAFVLCALISVGVLYTKSSKIEVVTGNSTKVRMANNAKEE